MSKSTARRSTGFSLIEIMVGLAIGMLAIIVILQVFSLSEQRKRTTTGGGDAQSTGAIAFYQLQRDLSQAGYGLNAMQLLSCSFKWPVASGGNVTTAAAIAPVTINPPATIIPAGDANTDTLLIMYGNTNTEPEGNPVQTQAGTTYTMQMVKNAFAVNEHVIAAPLACGASELLLDKVSAIDADAHTVTTGVNKTGTTLYNFGPSPTLIAYAIRGGNLTACDYTANDCGLAANVDNVSIWVPIASNIVSMRAQYARDTDGTMDAIPNLYDQTSPTTNCGWVRVPALRMVLVARSAQFEKDPVTTAAPTWAGSVAGNPAGSASNPINLTANASWQNYRYKVFETIVPIRNVTWMGVPAGC
tara:strand:- start:135045 stop:136121 length:1077 start_codon:yes stop_codon:yes gene_type:complete